MVESRKSSTSQVQELKEKKNKKLTPNQRATLTIMKFLAVPMVGILLFMIGMAIGYKFGGGATGEVFSSTTWRNIFLIIFG